VTDLAQSIAELTQPTTHDLQRVPPNDTQRAEMERAERKALRQQVEVLRERQMHQAIDALLRRHGAELAGRTTSTAAVPSLLDQLADAVQGSGGTNGAGGAGAYRAAIGLAAAGLLAAIRTTLAYHGDDLAGALRAWQPDDEDQAAIVAAGWVTQGRAIVEPPRWSEVPAPCPLCGTRYVTGVVDGERTRRAAVRINLSGAYAQCDHEGCIGFWDEDHLRDLAGLL